MRPASRTTDYTPQGIKSGREARGTRKPFRIWQCGILGGNALGDDIGFAPPIAPLLEIKVIFIDLVVETRSAKWVVIGGLRLEKMSERRNTKVDWSAPES